MCEKKWIPTWGGGDQVRCTWHENSSKPSAICSNILLMQWQHAWEMASQYYLEANSFAKLSEPSRCFLYFSNLYLYSYSHVKKKLKTEGSAFPATHALHTQKLKCFWLESKKKKYLVKMQNIHVYAAHWFVLTCLQMYFWSWLSVAIPSFQSWFHLV